MVEFNTTVTNEKSPTDFWKLSTIGLIVLSIILIGLAIWLFMSYTGQKTDVDTKISNAVNLAVKKQVDTDEAKFAKREKEPNREFVGPDDYGRVTFNYPKTWSVYVANDVTNGGTYEAYLNPVAVPSISDSQQFALRVIIENTSYSSVIASYSSLVKNGDLNSSSITANGITGTRLDGKFTDDIRGSAVIFKIRDKTLTIRTDADTFTSDFDALVTTIKFNQ
jgi:hypothetical protein